MQRRKRKTTPGRSAPRPNPDHHIWCNNGTYFIHLTLLWRGCRKRVRTSLKTKDIREARRRRDRFLETLRGAPELTLLCRLPAGRVASR